MNLHSIAVGYVSAVNPVVPCSVRVSTGHGVSGDYTPTPTYATPVIVQGQIQALTFKDIQQLDGLNLQGTQRAIYLYGDVEGLIRVSNKGGDLITTPDGKVWLVSKVLENWGQDGSVDTPGWVKVAVTLQNGS